MLIEEKLISSKNAGSIEMNIKNTYRAFSLLEIFGGKEEFFQVVIQNCRGGEVILLRKFELT